MAITPTSAVARIGKMQERNLLYRSMIDGTFALPFANRDDARYTEFKRLLEWARIDIAGVIVDTTAERLTVEGFRTDPKSLEGDDAAWEVWDRVGGPLTSQLAIIDALSVGDSYLLIERDEDGMATMCGETSDSMIVVYKPGSRTVIDYAAKTWREVDAKGDPVTYCTMFDKDRVQRFMCRGELTENAKWEASPAEPNPLGFVPVAHIRNRPTLSKTYGRSELWGLTNDIGRVNKLSADLMLISEFSAFKVRYGTGIETDTDPITGKEIAPFNIGPDRLLTSENDLAKFGSLEETPLSGHLETVKALLTQVAALSRTPLFYLTGDIVNVGEGGLRAMDMQAVAKAEQRQLELDAAFANAMRMLLKAEGSPLAEGTVQTMWRDPEKRSYAELADSVTKLTSGDDPVLPKEQAWIELGYSPTERERMKAYATQDAARRRAAAMTSSAIAGVSERLRAGQQQPDQQQPSTA